MILPYVVFRTATSEFLRLLRERWDWYLCSPEHCGAWSSKHPPLCGMNRKHLLFLMCYIHLPVMMFHCGCCLMCLLILLLHATVMSDHRALLISRYPFPLRSLRSSWAVGQVDEPPLDVENDRTHIAIPGCTRRAWRRTCRESKTRDGSSARPHTTTTTAKKISKQ